MWIAFSNARGAGFVSIVAKGYDNKPSSDLLCFRFRRHDDALKLGFRNADIIDTAKGDYACRVYVPVARGIAIITGLAASVDYDNFKNSIPADDDQMYDAASDAWGSFMALQDRDDLYSAPPAMADTDPLTGLPVDDGSADYDSTADDFDTYQRMRKARKYAPSA
jgi:hypothetical protein